MKVDVMIVDYNNPSKVYRTFKNECCTYPEDLEDIIFGIDFNKSFKCELVLCMYSYKRKTFTILVTDFEEREDKLK